MPQPAPGAAGQGAEGQGAADVQGRRERVQGRRGGGARAGRARVEREREGGERKRERQREERKRDGKSPLFPSLKNKTRCLFFNFFQFLFPFFVSLAFVYKIIEVVALLIFVLWIFRGAKERGTAEGTEDQTPFSLS